MLSFRLIVTLTGVVILTAQLIHAEIRPHERDFQMWLQAQEIYGKAHGDQPFQPEHIGVEAFDHIADLKEKLLATAKTTGRLKGAINIGVQGTHHALNRAVWFTTIVHPQDRLGREMGLRDTLALVFWRQDRSKSLLWIDTVPDVGVDWDLKTLETVLLHL